MAKQLNLIPSGQVITTALHTEMQRSYLEYAMSVIVGRALPDVRDGLKPVHRRILYAMHELGLTPDRPYRKCARVVGDVLGKYHPHGDQAVYDALVRLVQDFSSRYPLLGGHGNFGSVDNDPPAAMRYTETRLAPVSHEGMLAEIGEETVEFIPNFDNSQQEPTVLPAQLPFLLLNGCTGIAVGMATNVPPHNLGEIVDGLVALIDNPELSDDKLFELIPGPDFPTGGEIVGDGGIRDAYRTGRGSITLRGIAQIEEIAGSRGSKRRTAIVVTELPYQVNKAGWIEKVADLVNQGRLVGISDIRDESDREGMRVVVELKRDTNPDEVLHHLYQQTALQVNFGAILLALVDGQPRQLSLRELLQEFLNFREATLNRRYRYELGKAENRLHLLEGLLTALKNVDRLIEILRQSADGSSAKVTLQNELQLSETQADAILAMPMRRLTGMEQQNLQREAAELATQIDLLRRLLSDRKELLKSLKKDLRNLKRKFGDERRTRINLDVTPSRIQPKSSKSDDSQPAPASTPSYFESAPEDVVLEFTHRGYVRRLSPNRKSKTEPLSENDAIIQTIATATDKELIIITNGGKAYPLKVAEIPPSTGRNSRGTPLVTLLSSTVQESQETILTRFLLPKNAETQTMILATKQGRIKRISLAELTSLSKRGITLIKLKDEDELISTQFVSSNMQLILASSSGRMLRMTIHDDELPIMGRNALGVQGLRLGKQQHLVGCIAINPQQSILLVTEEGQAKNIPVLQIPISQRGSLGAQIIRFNKTDYLTGIIPSNLKEIALISNQQRLIRMETASIPVTNQDAKGQPITELNRDERITSIIGLASSTSTT